MSHGRGQFLQFPPAFLVRGEVVSGVRDREGRADTVSQCGIGWTVSKPGQGVLGDEGVGRDEKAGEHEKQWRQQEVTIYCLNLYYPLSTVV